MTDQRILPQEQVLRIISQSDPREFLLFLGAGASHSSGVPLASQMIGEWRQLAFKENAAKDQTLEAWLSEQKDWYGSAQEYSLLFELLFPDERARQVYIGRKIKDSFPSWGYLYLANIIRSGHINLTFTTNFDDLLNEALSTFIGYNAVVCAADSEVMSINVATSQAKIIKLHGDYLFKKLRNTKEELQGLSTNMGRKFAEFARQCGMVVVGYAGADESIMAPLRILLNDADTFPNGIYWGVHSTSSSRPDALQKLLDDHPNRLRLFSCESFDGFMAGLHDGLGLDPPLTILEPLKAARSNIDRLVAGTTELQKNSPTIRGHFERLTSELGDPIAQASEGAVLDLFNAQIALGSRDYAKALEAVERSVASKPADALTLTIWGTALMIKGEEEGDRQLGEMAADKWRQAMKLDANWTGARYSLMRYYALRQDFRQAIELAEELIVLAPNDTNLRHNLAQLYASVGRTREALRLLDALLVDDPENVMLHLLRASALEQRGLPGEALKEAQRAAQIAPANPWVRFQAAQGFVRAARPMEAASEFAQAIQLDPSNTGFRLQAASFFVAINQAPQALLHLREAARLEPDSSEVLGWLAYALLVTGGVQEAQQTIEGALAIDPENPRLLATAAQIYMTGRQLDRAEHCLRRAIESNPHPVGPYVLLAQLYAMGQQWPQFQGVMQQIQLIDPMVARQIQQQMGLQAGAANLASIAARTLTNWLGNNNNPYGNLPR